MVSNRKLHKFQVKRSHLGKDGYKGFIGGGNAECIRVYEQENKQSTKPVAEGEKDTGIQSDSKHLEGEDVESVGSTTVLLSVTGTWHVALSRLEGSGEVGVVTVTLNDQRNPQGVTR